MVEYSEKRAKMNLMAYLFGQRIEPEALSAYLSRLPNQIEVEWHKEKGFFVGRVTYDDFSFITQGKNHEEFIKLVSESVLVTLNIPAQYVNYLSDEPIFQPNQLALEELINNDKGKFRIVSNLQKKQAHA